MRPQYFLQKMLFYLQLIPLQWSARVIIFALYSSLVEQWCNNYLMASEGSHSSLIWEHLCDAGEIDSIVLDVLPLTQRYGLRVDNLSGGISEAGSRTVCSCWAKMSNGFYRFFFSFLAWLADMGAVWHGASSFRLFSVCSAGLRHRQTCREADCPDMHCSLPADNRPGWELTISLRMRIIVVSKIYALSLLHSWQARIVEWITVGQDVSFRKCCVCSLYTPWTQPL